MVSVFSPSNSQTSLYIYICKARVFSHQSNINSVYVSKQVVDTCIEELSEHAWWKSTDETHMNDMNFHNDSIRVQVAM